MPMRRPAASPPSSSSSMDHHRAPPSSSRELRLLSAVVPSKKRRSPRSPKPAATIVPVPPPAPALPVPPCVPHQIPAPPAAAGAADADADAYDDSLMLLAHTVVSQADAEAAAEASFPPAPAPAPPVEKLRSSPSPPPAAAHEEKPFAPPPLPALAVDHQNPSSSSMGHGDAATKAACPQSRVNAGSSSKRGQRGGGVAPSAAGALASPLPQPGSDVELELGEIPGDDEELELGEIPPEKPAAGCNADSAAHESSLGKEEMMTEGEEEAKTTMAGEPAATGSSAARRAAPAVVVSTAVVGRDGKAAAEMPAAEEKRMKEVFVGGLSRDARVEDVRAALSAAGEITEVRMIRDRATRKNKDFCFVAYRDAAMASKAIAEFHDVKICGQPCRLAVPEGNEKANKIAQRDPIIEDYNRIYEQRQAVHSSYIPSWDPHAWYENNTYAIPVSSYVVSPVGYYIPMYRYHNGRNRIYLPPPDLNHGLARPSGRSQMGQSGSSRPAVQPHRGRN